MTTTLMACLAGYAVGASAMEPAAMLRQPQGRVFVGQGSAMTPAQDGMPLYTGNRVIAVSGGRAEIAYAEGCVVALPENSLLAVKGADQCRLGQTQIRATGGFQSARIGQAPPAADGVIADLKRLQGSVLLNEAPAWNNQNAHRDDQVVTEKQSKVAVMFRACEVDMGSGEQATVSELRERCKSGVFLASGEDPNAEIAIIKRPQGSVLIDRGAARTDMGVKAGNRIITGTGSRVTVVFKGCEVILDENEKDRIGNLVTKCKGGLWTDAGAPVGAGIAGAGAGVGIGTGAIVIGGGLGVVLIGAIVADRGGNEPPASPQ
ncbi:MAG: hypothetical protein P9F75_19925 [Candidatus Contendobacter sp.]|nr:hypothetical protein [Candidatus Contendobacter sp.]